MSEERETVESVRSAFAAEFEPFANAGVEAMSLDEAEASLRELGELKVRHTGKKSGIANAKKLIGKVAAEERSYIGKLVQSVEKEIAESLEIA